MTAVGEHAEPVDGYGVVLDESGPVALAGDQPAVVLPAGLTLAELAESPLLPVLDAYPELPGFVVVAPDGAVAGVLPVAVLDEYLGSGEYQPAPSVMGPGGTAGDVDVPGDSRLPRARVRCRDCGQVNTLTFFDPAHPPSCANPDLATHPLVIG